MAPSLRHLKCSSSSDSVGKNDRIVESRQSPVCSKFVKKPPPRPGGKLGIAGDRGKPNILSENGASKREITGPIFREKIRSQSGVTSQRPGNTNVVFATTMSDDTAITRKNNGIHYFKDDIRRHDRARNRRGTPKRALPAGKDNPKSMRDSCGKEASPTVKSLFAPICDEIEEGGNLVFETSVDAKCVVSKDDPWDTVRLMSPNKQRQQYWKLCYGSTFNADVLNSRDIQIGGWSARRKYPRKGCLSNCNEAIPAICSRDELCIPLSLDRVNFPPSSFATPRSSPSSETIFSRKQSSAGSRSVQFGPTQAAEYDEAHPALSLTPIPAEQAALRYPTEQKATTQEEVSLLRETKENTAILDAWDEQVGSGGETVFKMPIQSSDSGEDGYEQQELCSRKKRRSSAFFSPLNGSRSLVEQAHDTSTEIIENQDEPRSPPNEARVASSSHFPSDSTVDVPGLSSSSTVEDNSSSTVEEKTLSTNEQPNTSAFLTEKETPQGFLYQKVVVETSRGEMQQKRFLFDLLDWKSVVKIVSEEPHLLWTILANTSNTGKTSVKANRSSWFRCLCFSSSLIPTMIKFVDQLTRDFLLHEKEQVNGKQRLNTFSLIHFLTNYEKQLVMQRRKILSLIKASVPATVSILGHRQGIKDLEEEINKLSAESDLQEHRNRLLKQNRDLRSEQRQALTSFICYSALRVLAPVQPLFLPNDAIQLTFDPEWSRMSRYSPALTIQVSGNTLTGFVTGVRVVTGQNYFSKTELYSLLEKEINRLDGLSKGDLDCSEAITKLLLVLSCLEWQFFHDRIAECSKDGFCN